MEKLYILSIDNKCQISYPCQHLCSCRTKDGTLTDILVCANVLVDYPELMNDYLLEHFAHYKPSLKTFSKKGTCLPMCVDEIKRLYQENYWRKRQILINRVILDILH